MNKYYIKQYVINDYSFQQWKDNFTSEKNNSTIIGYYFYTRDNKFGTASLLLNVYLINKKHYMQEGIRDEVIKQDWELFFNDPRTRRWVNPPLDIWLNTKDNWCKKLAHSISNKFSKTFDEALSDVYYSIVMCYNRKDVYMGSLDYITRTVYTDVLMSMRKSRFYKGEISSNEILYEDKDGSSITIEDTLVAESDDSGVSDLEYKDVYKRCVELMKLNFSEREIDQIITHPFHLLDRNMYQRLLNWRNKHNSDEITKEY